MQHVAVNDGAFALPSSTGCAQQPGAKRECINRTHHAAAPTPPSDGSHKAATVTNQGDMRVVVAYQRRRRPTILISII